MRTWKLEMLVVAVVLVTVNWGTHRLLSMEMMGSLAVLLSFGHAQIADRLAEQEGLRLDPKVDCYHKMWYYFVSKEVCWLLYFAASHTYSALVGVFVFLAYPIWRRLYCTWKNNHDCRN